MHKIKHLYWRAGFGLSPQEWTERQNWTIRRSVDQLFAKAETVEALEAPAPVTDDPNRMNEEQAAELRKKERSRVNELNVEWLERMGSPAHSALLERTSLFWHGHFACRTVVGEWAVNQLNTIRQHALGNFRDLLLAIAKDGSMIRYLNNQQNRKQKPNENFARELLELFTIGRGHYTEQDIKEAARAFTGWSSTLKGEFVFRTRFHDFGRKTFFGKTGNFNGEDIIDIILEREETAYFIAKKIYRYFVNDQVDENIVREMAQIFYQSDYDIGTLLRGVFESDWFYSRENRGVKIKSPVELMAGMIRALNIQFEQKIGPLIVEKTLGQILFNPPNVAGWPGGKSWIDNATLMFRLNLIGVLFGASEINMRERTDLEATSRSRQNKRLAAKLDLAPFGEWLETANPESTFRQLSDFFLQTEPTVDYKTSSRFLLKNNPDNLLKTMILRLLSLPEYQMC